MAGSRGSLEARACNILHDAYGGQAQFRPGQLDAIVDAVSGRNSLVIQKTGWGKSLVYFVATKILRQDGAGPTLIISPLLALMENQIEAASVLGLKVETINSDNRDAWDFVYDALARNKLDALIVSPERFGDQGFMERLAYVRGIRLLVVDEAHCISTWGHDFRPDYQRITKLIEGLPGSVTVLGTTATANDRVIDDVRAQLGTGMLVVRGDLMRSNLAIQVNPVQSREQRLAWLAQVLTHDPVLSRGQGIVYCLTKNTCNMVAEFLVNQGVSARSYYSNMGVDENKTPIDWINLRSFVLGGTRVIVSTTKLGMGFDKPDIRFVIHFQFPENIIGYYQQIGRAGRDGKPSYAVLLHGAEDEEVIKYFIKSAQAAPDLLARIVRLARFGTEQTDLLRELNVKPAKLSGALKYLQVHGYLYKDGSTYRANPSKRFDEGAELERQRRLTDARIGEHQAFLDFMRFDGCSMGYLARELDAPDAQAHCGICANCRGNSLFPTGVDSRLLQAATVFLRTRHGVITPRKQWASRKRIDPRLAMQKGWCLCDEYYSDFGQKVKEGKYVQGAFSSELVSAAVGFLRRRVRDARIDCVVPITSPRRPRLVPDYARAVAGGLGLAYVEAIERTCASAEQKTMENSLKQEENIRASMRVCDAHAIRGKTVLLVDDMVDSRWTFTVAAAELLEAGARAVYPFALVKTGSGD